MRKAQIIENANSKFLRVPAASARYGLGKGLLKDTAEKAGAVVRIGRTYLVSVDIMDNYMMTMTGANQQQAAQ